MIAPLCWPSAKPTATSRPPSKPRSAAVFMLFMARIVPMAPDYVGATRDQLRGNDHAAWLRNCRMSQPIAIVGTHGLGDQTGALPFLATCIDRLALWEQEVGERA